MLIEFQNCEIEIGHIGTPMEIAGQIISESAQEMGNALRSMAEKLIRWLDGAMTAVMDMLSPVVAAMSAMPIPPAVVEAERVSSVVSEKTYVPYETCLDAWVRAFGRLPRFPDEADVMMELGL